MSLAFAKSLYNRGFPLMAFRFDPRDLIAGPFVRCPNCGQEQFGIQIVGGRSYQRRCRNCWYGARFALPELSRKVLYVDQFVISNMMKALDGRHPRHQATVANPFWRTLFERLDGLVKLQVVICPPSDVHRSESLVSAYYEPLKRMSEQLSQGVSFDEMEVISQRQLYVALDAWLQGQPPQFEFAPERVTHGGLNDWKEPLIISVRMNYPQAVIAATRTFRDEVHRKVTALFAEEIHSAEQKEFKYWLDRERSVGANAVLQSHALSQQRMADMVAGRVPFDFDNMYSSSGLKKYQLVEQVLEDHEVSEQGIPHRIKAFLESEAYKDFPANRITALAWAAIDQAAALGKSEPPNAGTANDIHVLTLLPFCDAMFVDNGCRALWEKVPKRFRPPYARAWLFSYNTRDKFLTYLDELEAQADPAVLASARELYGEPQPYVTMYEDERAREARRRPPR